MQLEPVPYWMCYSFCETLLLQIKDKVIFTKEIICDEKQDSLRLGPIFYTPTANTSMKALISKQEGMYTYECLVTHFDLLCWQMDTVVNSSLL